MAIDETKDGSLQSSTIGSDLVGCLRSLSKLRVINRINYADHPSPMKPRRKYPVPYSFCLFDSNVSDAVFVQKSIIRGANLGLFARKDL